MTATIPVKITAITEETSEAKTFTLEPVGQQPLPYGAGQFLTCIFPKPYGEDRRNYSFSSAPFEDRISITVKKIPNGEYSRMMVDRLIVGDIINTIGASGFFTLPDQWQEIREVFFLAAGSGITPIFSLIKSILKSRANIRLVLIYSNRSSEDTIFYRQLLHLEVNSGGRLNIEWLFSTNPDLNHARLSKWLLELLVTKWSRARPDQKLFYLCGSFDYMRMATIQLLTMDIPVTHIRKENFVIFKPEHLPEPPDKALRQVRIILPERTQTIAVQYPQTILAAARKAGLAIPYSCEAGRCGTCAMRCTSGEVWMSYNEVLLDEEIDKGWVLTCTGYPVNGNVELR